MDEHWIPDHADGSAFAPANQDGDNEITEHNNGFTNLAQHR